MSLSSKAPGPTLQWLNGLLHQEPYSFLAYGLYWCIVLVFLAPLCGIVMLIQTTLQFVLYLLQVKPSVVDTKEYELAVVITGCDHGFGQDLAFALSKRGFVVFAGCLRPTQQFDGEQNVITLQMDVTNDEQVEAAVKAVTKWLEDGGERKRYLHGVVNNAGTCDETDIRLQQ